MTDRHPSRQRRTREQEPDGHTGFSQHLGRRLTSLSWLGRAAGVGLCTVSLGFVVLFAFVVGTGGDLTLVSRPLAMQVALTLPPAIAVLTAATTVSAVSAWWNGYWSLRARLHQTLLALLGLGLSWQLATIGFLPP